MTKEDLKSSEKNIGQIYPVIKDQFGNILDGFHRKDIDPNWREITVDVIDPLHALRIRVHSNVVRRDVEWEEKHNWVMEARRLLNPKDPMQPSQKEVAKALVMSQQWVSDHETLPSLGNGEFKSRPFNIWNFSACDKRFGKQDFKGRIPGQIIQNILFYILENKNGKIVDPMAGGGVTHDVVEKWWNKDLRNNAKCLSYDIKPTRDFIEPNDMTRGLPIEAQNCDLMIIDPPYFDMKFSQFKSSKEFYSWLNQIAEVSYKNIKNGGKLCILMADNTKHSFKYLRGKTYETFKNVGFGEPIAVISVPMTTEQANKNEVLNARESKKLLGRDRTLFVFRKVTS